MADIAPVLMTVVAKQAMDMMTRSSSRRYSTSPSTPRRNHHRRSPSPRSPYVAGPLPDKGAELHMCLVDMQHMEGIDLLQYEDALATEDFTPDILSMVAVKDLCELTGAVKGRMLKLQRFADKWTAALEKKRGRRL